MPIHNVPTTLLLLLAIIGVTQSLRCHLIAYGSLTDPNGITTATSLQVIHFSSLKFLTVLRFHSKYFSRTVQSVQTPASKRSITRKIVFQNSVKSETARYTFPFSYHLKCIFVTDPTRRNPSSSKLLQHNFGIISNGYLLLLRRRVREKMTKTLSF